MKTSNTEIEQLTIRRANIADAAKVRYRVYSTPTEFIAVIAENALMAVKLSGITKPHKIVRDMPTNGAAVPAREMAPHVPNAERVSMRSKQSEAPKAMMAELSAVDPDAKLAAFTPLGLKDLKSKKQDRARILPPDMLNQIIEEHARAALGAAFAPPPEPKADPMPSAAPPADLSPKERLMQMADEVFPEAEAKPEEKLSPEEVAKLLNG